MRISAAQADKAGGVGAESRVASDPHPPLAVEQPPLRLQNARPRAARLPHPPVLSEGDVRPPVHAGAAREPGLECLDGAVEAGRLGAGVPIEVREATEPGAEGFVRAVVDQA